MKKNLLNESEIRKFMKFANLQPLTENFIENTTNLEEEVVEETPTSLEEETLDEEILSEEDVDVKDLVTKLMQVITDETGVEVTVDEEGAEPGMADDDLGDLEEPADDMGEEPGLGDEVESGEPPVPPGDEEEAEGDDLMLEMVERVSHRVAARLLKESRAN